jgi:hypothetical protein
MDDVDGELGDSSEELATKSSGKAQDYPKLIPLPTVPSNLPKGQNSQKQGFPGTVIKNETKNNSRSETQNLSKNIEKGKHENDKPELNILKNFDEKKEIESREGELKAAEKEKIPEFKEITKKNLEKVSNDEKNGITNNFGKALPLKNSNKESSPPKPSNLHERLKSPPIRLKKEPFSKSETYTKILLGSSQKTLSSCPIINSDEVLEPSNSKFQSLILTTEATTVEAESTPNPNTSSSLILLLSRSLNLQVQNTETLKTFHQSLPQPTQSSTSCRKCKSIYLKLKLECGHFECLTCYQHSIENLLKLLNFSTFSKCSCSVCGMTSSTNFLSKVLPKKSFEILQLSLMRKCVWCKRELDLFQHHFPRELKCKHLCDICYQNEVFFKSKACFCCNSPFKNLEFTLKRSTDCFQCGDSGLFIANGYRMTSSGKGYCSRCILDLMLHDTSNNQEKRILKNFLNIKCPKCNCLKNVADIIQCATCQSFCCESCNPDYTCLCIENNS